MARGIDLEKMIKIARRLIWKCSQALTRYTLARLLVVLSLSPTYAINSCVFEESSKILVRSHAYHRRFASRDLVCWCKKCSEGKTAENSHVLHCFVVFYFAKKIIIH